MFARPRRLSAAEIDAYDVLPRPLARRVVVVQVPLLPPGAHGMTIGRVVLLLDDHDRGGDRRLLAHELVHVRQFAELGRVRFAWRYLGAYARNLWRLRHHDRAYRAIPAEVQAYGEAAAWAERRAASAVR